MKIQPLNLEPKRTIGDDLPYFSEYYEKVPEAYRLKNLILPNDRYPKTAKILDDIIETADLYFHGWEIVGRTFEDFGRRVKVQYRRGAESLERYIETMAELKVALSSSTKVTVGPGKVTVNNDLSTDTNNTNTQTLNTQVMNSGVNVSNVHTEGEIHSDGKNETVTDGDVDRGPIAIRSSGDRDTSPAETSKAHNKTTVTPHNDGTTKSDNNSTISNINEVANTGTIKNTLDGKVHVGGKVETDTQERITTTESVTPGAAIAELANIKNIESVDDYFINMLRPCFTTYRWVTW